MSCLLPWPPEMYSLLCLRWEKSLPTDLRVLRGSTDSLHVQTHQMLSGVCLLSAGVFLVCRKTTRMQLGDRKLNSPLLSDRWVSPSWIYFCNSLCRKHVPLRITISRGFLKTTTTSLQSAQGFCHTAPNHQQRIYWPCGSPPGDTACQNSGACFLHSLKTPCPSWHTCLILSPSA